MNQCLNCEKRSLGCHSSCKDYKDYKQDLEKKAAQKRAFKSKTHVVEDTLIQNRMRIYKRRK